MTSAWSAVYADGHRMTFFVAIYPGTHSTHHPEPCHKPSWTNEQEKV